MAKSKNASKVRRDQRSGGVYIEEKARVEVGGDLVGRDKISITQPDAQLEDLFDQLREAILNDKTLGVDEKQAAVEKSAELKAELKQPEPDLGKLSQIKKFLIEKGGAIAGVVGAIFQYPPIQETIKVLAQRLIGV